jgi:hypothetical protein
MRQWKFGEFVGAVLIFSGALHACPLCQYGLSNGDPQGWGALPDGFNTSIELMLGGFLAVVTLVAAIIWKGIRG